MFVCFLMVRRPPISTQSRSSAASDVYKRQKGDKKYTGKAIITGLSQSAPQNDKVTFSIDLQVTGDEAEGTVA